VLAAGDEEEGGAVNSWLMPWQAHRRRWDGSRELRRCRGKARTRGGHRDGMTAASGFIYGGEQRGGVPWPIGVASSSAVTTIF
jgi:hypothetical protein